MDKLEFAKKLLLQRVALQGIEIGRPLDIRGIFDTVEAFFLEAQVRGYIPMEACPKCKSNVQTIDLLGAYRVQCQCSKGTGANEAEAFSNWLNKV